MYKLIPSHLTRCSWNEDWIGFFDRLLTAFQGLHNMAVFRGRDTCNFFSIILEDLKKPSGLAIDLNCGVIAVTDWCGDKLVFYSYSGSKLASYGGFKCPHSVSINNNHKVIVTDSWNNQLNVLHYQPKIWAVHMADFVLQCAVSVCMRYVALCCFEDFDSPFMVYLKTTYCLSAIAILTYHPHNL